MSSWLTNPNMIFRFEEPSDQCEANSGKPAQVLPSGMATEYFSSAARFRKVRCRLPFSVFMDASFGNLMYRLSASAMMSVILDTCAEELPVDNMQLCAVPIIAYCTPLLP